MYIPLQLRLTLFYTLVLGLALWFFGHTVYAQAEQSKVLPFMEFLPRAGQHFVPTHTG